MSARSASELTLLLCGADDAFLSVARAAGQAAFPLAEVIVLGNLAGALERKQGGAAELLVLDAPQESELAAACRAVDSGELPRWAIVARMDSDSGCDETVTAVPPEDWNARLVAQIFRAALVQQRLRREVVRSRADFLTIGTRIMHDMRSPLGGVLTTAEALKEMVADDAPGPLALANGIVASAEESIALVGRLSFFAKATAQVSPVEPLNMAGTVWAALQRCERRVLATGATLTQPDDWPDVVGNAAWIETIWQNLLTNALTHAGPSPRISLGWDKREGLRFWVGDNGDVAPAKRGSLFQPFNLLHHANAPRGLGLPIVQRLVELQGGRCGYESIPGGGSFFYFTLPPANPPEVGNFPNLTSA